jgi:hypothetical protein
MCCPILRFFDFDTRPSNCLLRKRFVGLVLAFAFSALASPARAVTPAPDGGYSNFNTAEGDFSLNNLTSGDGNTALGYAALTRDTTGRANTAVGDGALFFNISGVDNTAVGWAALQDNNTGIENTATGSEALVVNTTGGDNTAMGIQALSRNTTGSSNTANGAFSLLSNTAGSFNTASGENALRNDTGSSNTAMGIQALNNNTSGSNNTAVGALAGQNLTGNNNIDIGANVLGAAGEANTIRIGKQGTQKNTLIAGIFGTAVSGTTVVVGSNGKLGVATSSSRFKESIKPMDSASKAVLKLNPVTFRYKEEIDPDGIPQFGLIAEEVEKVDPDLVGRDEEGKANSVRYEAVNAMLLNEFLKEHRKNEEQQKTIDTQQKQIEALTAGLQKITARLESGNSS